MKIKKGIRAFCLLLVMALLGAVFVPAVSADDENKSWPDTFDQWAGQRDMSKYNPDIKITPTKKIDEVNAKSYPGLILPSSKEGINFKSVDGEFSFLPDEKVLFTLKTKKTESETKDLIPDVRMTDATITWYWTQDTSAEQVINIHNYDSSAASGQVIFWSVEDGYGYSTSFSNLASGGNMTVNIPFQVIAQYSSIGSKPMAIEIRVSPGDLTSWSALMPFDAIEKYNNDASHLADPDNGNNLETSDLYHFPFSEGYAVLSKAAQAADDTNNPYESAYQTMNYVYGSMYYNNESLYLHFIISDLYMLSNPINEKYQGVCDEYATMYTAFMRSLGIPTRFLAFTMEETATGNSTGHGIAESWDGSTWIHSDPTWLSFDNPQIYMTSGYNHINITLYDDTDDSYNTTDPEDPTGDGILKYEDFRTQTYLGEIPRYN